MNSRRILEQFWPHVTKWFNNINEGSLVLGMNSHLALENHFSSCIWGSGIRGD
jgi:hypothetical protein